MPDLKQRPYKFVDLAEWKAAAAKGQAPAGAALCKQYVAQIVKVEGEGEESRKRTFIITTGSIDRDRDRVHVDGWKLENYLKNPVVLWAHYYGQPPVAKASDVVASDNALRSTAEFATKEMYPFADTVFQLVKHEFLRATSVGFNLLKWAYDEERRGWDILEQELLEYSVCPVPANPEALIEAKAVGIDLSPLKSWAEQVLDGMEPGLWLPKAAAERALKIAAGDPVTTSVPSPPSTPPADPAPAAVPPAAAAFVPSPDQVRASFRSAVSELVQSRLNSVTGRLD